MDKQYRTTLLITVFLLATAPAHAQNVSFTFDPPDTTAGCGDTLTVDIVLDGTITGLLGYSLQLDYDPAIFSPVSALEGSLAAGAPCAPPFFYWLNAGSNDGTVKVDMAMLGCTIDGPGSVLRVQFESLVTGATTYSSALTLSGTMRDSLNQQIAYSADLATLYSLCNNAPVAVADADTTDEDTLLTTLDVLLNDGDPDGDSLWVDTFDAFSTNGGTVAYNGDSTFDYDPPQDFNGDDTFTYTVTDGDLSDTGTVTIVVNDVNDPPQAVDDAAATDEDAPVDIDVLQNDVDSDGAIDSTSVQIVSGASNGVATVNSTTGVINYSPSQDFFGLDTLTYTVDDDDLATSNVARVIVTVNPINDPPDVMDPGPQTYTELDVVSLQIVATDPDPGDILTYEATDLPDGLVINATGLINGAITCGAASGSPFSAAVTVFDDAAPPETTTVLISWTVNVLSAPAAVTSLNALQNKGGNDSDGTTGIMVTWTASVSPSDTIKVYRKGFGGYPEYDDAGGAVPTAPVSPAHAETTGWALTSLATSGDTDEVSVRDFWYYIAFVVNGCGVSSPASNLTGGALNYHLGDVASLAAGLGDNLVDILDISKLGSHYGTVAGESLFVDTLDVGPTLDFGVDTRPATDDTVGFEDLVVFALNFGDVSSPGRLSQPSAEVARLTLELPTAYPQTGEFFEVAIELISDGSLRALSVPLRWDPEIVEPVGHASGELLQQQAGHGVLLSPEPGILDAVVFGAPFQGEGMLGSISFRIKDAGDPSLGFGTVRARDGKNKTANLIQELRQEGPSYRSLPAQTRLLPSVPNPFRASTTVRFDLAEDSRIRVEIFTVSGQLARILLDGHLPAGSHELLWNGRDDMGREVASGVYLTRLSAAGISQTKRMVRLR